MAVKNTRQLSQKELQEDLNAYAGMLGLTGFAPANAAFNASAGDHLKTTMEASQIKAVQDKAQSDASHDAKVSDQWAFHDYVRNMRIQVKAQYGEDSDEVAAVGLKKKSEYKNPKKKKQTP